MNAPKANSYDQVPYESHPFSQTHPERLALIATLFGLRPAAVARCRVLELGCAAGGNLIPMAVQFPEARFVGVDLSARQVGDGQKVIDAIGLKNVELRHASIMDVDATYGKFDYVLCHGVFSWVPNEVQDKILQIAADLLLLHGVAFISYNTYPGWHLRGLIREMMRYHAENFATPKMRTRQARALLDFMASSVRQDGGAYASLLKHELEVLQHQPDSYLFHEHLEDVNEPIFFHQFIERASAKGLQYLAESRVGTMLLSNFHDIEKTLRMLATDQIQAEQYMDFLRNRTFRETLLCHAGAPVNWAVQPDSLRRLHIASAADPIVAPAEPAAATSVADPNSQPKNSETKPDFGPPVDAAPTAAAPGGKPNEMSYRTPSGYTMSTTQPLLIAALRYLRQKWPRTVPFEQLLTTAREQLGAEHCSANTVEQDRQVLSLGALNAYLGSDLLELHSMPIACITEVSERPLACAYARYQATHSSAVTNRRHEMGRLNPFQHLLLPLMDGTNDRKALLQKLREAIEDGRLTVERGGDTIQDAQVIDVALGEVLEKSLAEFAQMALLVDQ